MVRIVTDSPSALTLDHAKQLGIDAVVASYVIFGEESWLENQTITPADFHARLKSSPVFPTTAAPSIGDFIKAYKPLEGESVVSIHLSRDLSGTVAAAEQAVKEVSANITVIDTRNVSAGEALLVLEALKMAKAGKSADEIKSGIEALIPRTHFHIVFETLDNLKRGGRIGSAQAFIGGVLQMKPILTVKHGKLEPLERVRTMPKAIARLKELAVNDLRGKPEFSYMVLHAAAPEAAAQVAKDLTETLGKPPTMVLEAGASVATHSGPGAVGVAYLI